MMKKIYVREIRHIVIKHAITSIATGYRMNSKSIVSMVILKMIKSKWLEFVNIEGQFMFVRPSTRLINAFRPVGIKNKIIPVLTLDSSLVFNDSTQNLQSKSVEIAAV